MLAVARTCESEYTTVIDYSSHHITNGAHRGDPEPEKAAEDIGEARP